MTLRIASSLVVFSMTTLVLAPPLPADDAASFTKRPRTVRPTIGSAARFAVSPPARSLPAPLWPASLLAGPEVHEVEIPLQPLPRQEAAEAAAARAGASAARPTSDPVVQSVAPAPSMPATSLSFDGISNLDNANAFGFRVLPPDTNGDVGPRHYVQTVNLLVRVFSKSGTPLTAPFKMSSLFAPLGGICASNDNGDPIVLYDELADRWLLSQFAIPAGTVPPFHQCIAISKSGDPTGAYFVYDFVMPGTKFNDYPHFGVWPDAYYMTDNQFQPPALNFAGAGAFAFDRKKMVAGDPTASFIYFDLALLDPGLGGMLAADLDGPRPPAGAPNTFIQFTADEFGDPADGIRLFDFHADFANPAASTFLERPESPLAVAAFDPTLNSRSGACAGSTTGFNGRDDIDQPPVPAVPAVSCNAKLDGISDRVLHRLQYRNFGAHETLVVNHTVDVNFTPSTSPTGHHAGVRYYELRRASGGPYTVNEQASFAPDTDQRWMGSAAEDSNGNLAAAYSVSSETVFASLRYAGRLASDPPNGLFQGEATLHAGAGSQANSASRWGDYSALSVDPADGCTFWFTSEYYQATDAAGLIPCAASGAPSSACWSTRIGRFRFPTCITTPSVDRNLILWPPNHQLVPVPISYTAGSSATCSLSVTSNEPVAGTGPGDLSPDWVVQDAHHVLLRAERAGNGSGRIYTITITCSDSGGSNSRQLTMPVAHDQGH
jgi:hypothetical protein